MRASLPSCTTQAPLQTGGAAAGLALSSLPTRVEAGRQVKEGIKVAQHKHVCIQVNQPALAARGLFVSSKKVGGTFRRAGVQRRASRLRAAWQHCCRLAAHAGEADAQQPPAQPIIGRDRKVRWRGRPGWHEGLTARAPPAPTAAAWSSTRHTAAACKQHSRGGLRGSVSLVELCQIAKKLATETQGLAWAAGGMHGALQETRQP